ncbi:SHOCT domain-containing protein [Patescibacteria group bacterium]|nr:SHOCT domain-containing protein [Patescibacteria group bacterium]
MGYKSTIRSVSSAGNKIARENEREERQKARELERFQKKIDAVQEKKDKVFQELDNQYAQGKINEEEFENLKQRQPDISIELIAIGKVPGVSLAKRYITGKIDKEEFERIQKEILPSGLFEEKEEIDNDIKNIKIQLIEFKKNCKEQKNDECQQCGKKKSFLNPIKEKENIKLCGKCRSLLSKYQEYEGFKGEYFIVEPVKIDIIDIDSNIEVDIILNSEIL